METDAMNSVSLMLEGLKDGDDAAAADLWRRYYSQLVQLAGYRLGAARGRYVDEEDVAIQAFTSMCRRAKAGQFPNLQDRDGLWRLLFRIVECKVINQRKHIANRKNQAIDQARLADSNRPGGIDAVANIGPTPDEVVIFQEELDSLIGVLEDESNIRVCLAKLEGYTNKEVADTLGCSTATVERKLRMIRGHLSQELRVRNAQGEREEC